MNASSLGLPGRLWIAGFVSVLVWSAINPHDYFTWMLEVFPALVAAVALLVTRKQFMFTPLGYQLILLHCVVWMIGGHYTYALVPLGDWAQALFDLQRNNSTSLVICCRVWCRR